MNPRCKYCGGRQNVYKSMTSGLRRTRYLRCVACQQTNKSVVSIDSDGHETETPQMGLPASGNNIIEGAFIDGMIQQRSNNQIS
jgi:hypothetical protein